MSVNETLEVAPEHFQSCTKDSDSDNIQRESPSQPLNVSQDMCLIVKCKLSSLPILSSPKFHTDMMFLDDADLSQTPTSGTTAVSSQQPTPEFLMTLGIKVRDFAYENTLPAIVPVPRVPRQVQPAPRTLKRLQRDWDDKEGSLNSSSSVRPLSTRTSGKKPRSLERKATEPLQEPVVQHTRTLERITVKRVCPIVNPPSRSTLPTTPRSRFPASPPTSPLTPPPSHFALQESGVVHTSPIFPIVVHVENPGVIPVSESQPLHPVLYTGFTSESRSSPGCSPVPSQQNPPPAPLRSSFLELPSPAKELEANPRVRRRRGVETRTVPPSNRYQLRQRPNPSPRVSPLSRCSHQASNISMSLPRRTRRTR